MAALGKIRSKGVFLIIIIGLGLFGFIAGDMFRSCESTGREASNRAAVIFGEKIGAQDYQTYLEEFVECNKMLNPNASEEQIRQMAWNQFVANKIFGHEAEELGITVTDDEIHNMMTQGTHPALRQLMQIGFVDQQTGRFDVNNYKKFIQNYNTQKGSGTQFSEQDERLHKLVLFLEKQMRQQLIQQKYQSLLQGCILSNPYEAKFAFNAEKNESNIQLAYIDYRSINDNDVKVTDEDLKAKFDELKKRYYSGYESRSAKYILVTKEASEADKANLRNELNKAAEKLRNNEDANNVLREAKSNLVYLGLPVSKTAFPTEISTRLDSMAVGDVMGPVQGFADGKQTLSVMKLIAKSTLPDSVEYRVIAVGGTTKVEENTRADSVVNALKAGADFEVLAKKYAGAENTNAGAKQWMTTAQYERATNILKDDKAFISALNTTPVNGITKVPTVNGTIIVQVTDQKKMVTKYDVAVLQRYVDFSTETSTEITNKFNQFVAANQTLEDMEKNAKKSGYEVMDAKDVTTSNGGVAGIANSRDALKWMFEADKNDMSQIFTCGPNREQLLVMVLTNIYPKGYQTLDKEDVKEEIRQEVIRDKKAEQIIAKLKDVKTVEQAESKGAKVVEVNQITLASPAYVTELGSREPVLSGAVARTEKGQFSSHPVKGEAGVFVFKVTEKTTLPGNFDDNTAKEYQSRAQQENMRMLPLMDLEVNAEILDNRYLFF